MGRCRNIFCIFYKDGNCKLPEVDLDERGICSDCILLPMSKEAIEKHNESLKNMWADLAQQHPLEEILANIKRRKDAEAELLEEEI